MAVAIVVGEGDDGFALGLQHRQTLKIKQRQP
jgi:hypothetical protein